MGYDRKGINGGGEGVCVVVEGCFGVSFFVASQSTNAGVNRDEMEEVLLLVVGGWVFFSHRA